MTTLSNRLAELLKIRSGEGSAVTLMWVHSFFVGMVVVFLETPASSLFLTHFDVDMLPYFFMATAATTVAIGFLVTWLQPRFAPSRFFPSLLAILLLLTFGLYLALNAAMPRWLVLVFMVWKDVVWTLVVLEFWAVAGLLLHVRQGKRLFGLLNSGKILAALLGGLATPLIVPRLGALQLMLLGIAGLAGAFLSSGLIFRSPSLWPDAARIGEDPDEPGEGRERARGLATLFRDRFLFFFFAVTVVSQLAFYFLEYLFYDQVEQTYPDEDQIASFFGLYIGVGQGMNLLLSAFVTGRLLTRFGLGAGLLSVPVVVLAGILAAVASPFLPGGANAFFWCITGSKLLQEVLGSALEVPASRILYQPLGSRERLRVQTMLESIVNPATAGVAGLALILLPAVFALQAPHLLYFLLWLLIGWIVLAFGLRGQYTGALTRALQGRRFRDVDVSLEDASSLLVLERELKNPRPGGTIYCLSMLEELDHPALNRFLVRLLDHPAEMVRTYVLERLELRLVKNAEPEVARRIELERDPAVLGDAVRTFCALADDGGLERALGFLEASEPELRKGALIGLLRSGGIEGVLAAGTQLIRLIESDAAAERRFAAVALGEVGISSFYRPLIQLLADPEMRVRREALKAAGKLGSPGLVRPLIDNLGMPAVADAAVSSLIAFKDAALPQLEEEFRREETTISVRSRIVRIAGHVGSAKARDFLKGWIDHPQEDLRYDVLRALTKCGYRAAGEETERLRQLILFEAEDAAWTLATLIDLGEAEADSDIGTALNREIRKNTRRILMLLSFMYPAETVLKAKTQLEGNVATHRARAVELLDDLLDTDLKSAILPLIDDLSPRARLDELGKKFPQKTLGRQRRLFQLITRTSDKSTAWAKACAIYAVGRSRNVELEEALVVAVGDSDPFIRETAAWALAQLTPERLGRYLPALLEDPAEPVARLARWLLEAQSPVKVYGGLGYLARQAGYRVDFLERLLADPAQPISARRRAARILGSLGDPKARRALLRRLALPEAPVRGAILQSLTSAAEASSSSSEMREIEEKAYARAFEAEIAAATGIGQWLDDFPQREVFQRLTAALERELCEARERLLRLVSLLAYGSDYPTLAHWYLGGGPAEVPEGVRDAFASAVAAIPDASNRQSVQELLLGRRVPEAVDGDVEKPSLVDVLHEIAESSGVRTWTRACAIEMLGRVGLPECVTMITETLDDPDETVREVAYWALSKLSAAEFQREVRLRGEDASPRVARLVKHLVRNDPPPQDEREKR